MAKAINNHGIQCGYVFNPYYELMFVPSVFLKRTNSWYIIPKDAKLEGL